MLVEVIRFALAPGLDPDDFMRVNDRYQEDVAYQCRGLARRTVARDDEGRWVDIRLWADDATRDMAGDDEVRQAWNDAVQIESREVYRGI